MFIIAVSGKLVLVLNIKDLLIAHSTDFLYSFVLCQFIYTAAIVALFTYFEINSGVDHDNVTPADNFVTGRKLGILNILAETAIQTTLWGNKCCLLLLYIRLTWVPSPSSPARYKRGDSQHRQHQ